MSQTTTLPEPDLDDRPQARAPRVQPAWWRRWWLLPAALVVVLLLLAAVLLGSSGGSGGSGGGTSASVGGERGTLVGTGAPAAGGALPAPDANGGPPAADAVKGAPTAADSPRIVKDGTVVLVAPDGKVGATLAAVQRLVTQVRGYVSASSSQETGSSPNGTVTIRVPVASYELLVQRVRGLGVKVVSVTSSGSDITAQYADTAARIASLTAARGRFLVILGQARTIAETLSVQQRVDEVQGQIDLLEGQRRVLADQSDLATLTVTVSQKDGDVIGGPRGGLAQAWDDAVRGFTSGLEAVVAHSGRVLLVLLLLGVLLGLGRVLWLGWRRWHQARRTAP